MSSDEANAKNLAEIAEEAGRAYQDFLVKLAELERESRRTLESSLHDVDGKKIERIKKSLGLTQPSV